ncbi:group 1 truncated hemoglobin [Parvularcula sp. ZS-1/3]|uniref:Group 1 truncated hemoglobin n=1 Tax=Parvularcula mediterranea TaxID=2732508 RepID=A0A7Y3W5M9_9PROT|nr:group 1 truncated hemoglobin [Parvularcula mediterranea]NNU16446.1 group 1 truncated hemoglobin [Parvularcula mediterranea]
MRFFISTLFISLSLVGYAVANDRLYTDLGEKAGIRKIVEDFTTLSLADPLIAPTFEETNIERFKDKLTLQLCEVSGGPCVYDGLSMKASHDPLGLTQAHFMALVEVLQEAMRQNDIPFGVQNKLLRQLAPMKGDVVSE